VAIIPLYRDVLRTLAACPGGQPVWPRFQDEVYYPHRAFFEGLVETYGAEMFGPGGLPGAVEQSAPRLRQMLGFAPAYGMEQPCEQYMQTVAPLLPGETPNLYLGTLFFTAPAATISVLGRPAMTLGMERFHPQPPAHQPQKYWYHPHEVVEMIPHEAAHAARMQVLDLPPTPRRLSLLDMAMLEGTALTFTDLLLGRQTLATFMPPERMAWHEANDAAIRAAVWPEFEREGMPIFHKYFSATSPISGYWVGYSLCQEFLQRYGPETVTRLVGMPSREILAALGAPATVRP
jgi:hypothetical protein